jgi:predicted transcriptional regulator of viral defense system
MPKPTTQRSRALALLSRRPILRLKDFTAQEIMPETLARLIRERMIVRVARGLYQRADASADTGHSLAEAAALVPKGIVCLISALQFHELTLQMPSEVWMAIDRTAWRPRIEYPPVRIVRFSGTALTDGIKRHHIEGIDVAITEPARTIVDCFRYRRKVGLDVALEALREGLRQRKVTSDQLWRHATKMRVWSILKPYVEATSADGA